MLLPLTKDLAGRSDPSSGPASPQLKTARNSPTDHRLRPSQLAGVQRVIEEPGQPMPPSMVRRAEARFGHPLADVRLHIGPEAQYASRALAAHAFTIGRHIGFAAPSYGPETPVGKHLLTHELAHVVQQQRAGSERRNSIEPLGGPAEAEADRVASSLSIGAPQPSRIQATATIALTPASKAITPLISYSATDWAVTLAEESVVLAQLAADPAISTTISDLDTDGMLGALINRVDEAPNRRQLLQLLGARLDPTARALVEPHVVKLGREWELQFNLGRLGVTSAAAAFNPAAFASLVSTAGSVAFTGSGATGVSETAQDMPWVDQVLLAKGDPATTALYSNPIPGSLPAYLAGLTPAERTQQAELLLRRPITTVDPVGYAGSLPSRAQLIRAAAAAHKLHPQMLAAFLLAEQRDQSRNEDAAEYLGATSLIKKGNTSIGLGQVVVRTAEREDLFADLLSKTTRASLTHNDIAKLLASEEYNIFAVARYIRHVADAGAKISIATLPDTQATFPAIDMAAYAGDSSTWPDDNIRALGSEYTSRPWDDVLVPGWADFVFEAYLDVIASGVF